MDKKIEQIKTLINNTGVKVVKLTPEEVYEDMQEMTLKELAEDISSFLSFMYNLNEIIGKC